MPVIRDARTLSPASGEDPFPPAEDSAGGITEKFIAEDRQRLLNIVSGDAVRDPPGQLARNIAGHFQIGRALRDREINAVLFSAFTFREIENKRLLGHARPFLV